MRPNTTGEGETASDDGRELIYEGYCSATIRMEVTHDPGEISIMNTMTEQSIICFSVSITR